MAHFHWSYEYLVWGIKWGILQRMLADAPKYDYEDKKTPKSLKQATKLTNKNAADMMEYFNGLSGG